MYRDPEEKRFTQAKSRIAEALDNLQEEHHLSDLQMLAVLTSYQDFRLRYMLRGQ